MKRFDNFDRWVVAIGIALLFFAPRPSIGQAPPPPPPCKVEAEQVIAAAAAEYTAAINIWSNYLYNAQFNSHIRYTNLFAAVGQFITDPVLANDMRGSLSLAFDTYSTEGFNLIIAGDYSASLAQQLNSAAAETYLQGINNQAKFCEAQDQANIALAKAVDAKSKYQSAKAKYEEANLVYDVMEIILIAWGWVP